MGCEPKNLQVVSKETTSLLIAISESISLGVASCVCLYIVSSQQMRKRKTNNLTILDSVYISKYTITDLL